MNASEIYLKFLLILKLISMYFTLYGGACLKQGCSTWILMRAVFKSSEATIDLKSNYLKLKCDLKKWPLRAPNSLRAAGLAPIL